MGSLTTLIQAAGLWSYALVFVLTAAETSAFVGVVLPSETMILAAAVLAAHGTLAPLPLAAAVVAGGVTGDSIGYALGRLLGRRVADRRRSRPVRPGGRIDRAGGFLRAHGGRAVFTGRFLGFVRSFVPFAAGAARMPYRRFLGVSAAAAAAWGLGNVTLGYFLGAPAERLLHSAGLAGAGTLAAMALLALLVLRLRRRSRPEPRSTTTATMTGITTAPATTVPSPPATGTAPLEAASSPVPAARPAGPSDLTARTARTAQTARVD
ncbi:DedA family protein [Kitasatospora sp. NBC_01287]|uniref:DedA family protein n=1 Tax=Kitasatospora sp. NBC_01287 TaxID=2903573 RepID=UPI00224EB539|nr:DedA family protein [Kitasatospora sp. NBC_01287]MCX4744526.1 DedA family protein [Kitasatospora sp. NBC_01287]